MSGIDKLLDKIEKASGPEKKKLEDRAMRLRAKINYTLFKRKKK